MPVFRVAHLQHCANDAGLLRTIDEAHGAIRAGERLNACAGVPLLGNRQGGLFLRAQGRVVLGKELVGQIVARGGKGQGRHRKSSAQDHSGKMLIHVERPRNH